MEPEGLRSRVEAFLEESSTSRSADALADLEIDEDEAVLPNPGLARIDTPTPPRDEGPS